jgi:hypothetical protein
MDKPGTTFPERWEKGMPQRGPHVRQLHPIDLVEYLLLEQGDRVVVYGHECQVDRWQGDHLVVFLIGHQFADPQHGLREVSLVSQPPNHQMLVGREQIEQVLSRPTLPMINEYETEIQLDELGEVPYEIMVLLDPGMVIRIGPLSYKVIEKNREDAALNHALTVRLRLVWINQEGNLIEDDAKEAVFSSRPPQRMIDVRDMLID